MQVVEYPSSILREVSKEVTSFDDDLASFLDQMFDTMVEAEGIGLAAIQVAKPIRAFIISIVEDETQNAKDNLIEFINPKIVASNGSVHYQEGCLSLPGFYEEIERHEEIELSYQDRFGSSQAIKATGLLSIAIQHELDHLNGVLFVDKLPFMRRKKFEKEFKKLKKSKKNRS